MDLGAITVPQKESVSSSLGNRTVAGSDRSDISSASFGIIFFYCQKYDTVVPLYIEEFV
jgi:hypothetical protein